MARRVVSTLLDLARPTSAARLLVVADVVGDGDVRCGLGEVRIYAGAELLPYGVDALSIPECERAQQGLADDLARQLGHVRALPAPLRRLAEHHGLDACSARAIGALLGAGMS